MKKILFSFGLIIFVAFSASAQVSSSDKSTQERKAHMQKATEQAPAQAASPNAPVIKFDKLVHNYGDLEQHGDGKCKFTFTNNGKEPLILSNVRSSCGCTVPEWPRQPILPGQSETIKVKYDTKRIGAINKTIHVYSNATDSPVTLRIKGTVHAAGASTMPEKKMERNASPLNK